MKVILLERVEGKGVLGDVVTVKDGFARNFLLPRKKALRANEANKKVFEANRERIVAENAARRTDAEAEAKTLEGVSVTLIRQSSNTGQLYGSVATRDIADCITAEGVSINRAQVEIHSPIKTIADLVAAAKARPMAARRSATNSTVGNGPSPARMSAKIASSSAPGTPYWVLAGIIMPAKARR